MLSVLNYESMLSVLNLLYVLSRQQYYSLLLYGSKFHIGGVAVYSTTFNHPLEPPYHTYGMSYIQTYNTMQYSSEACCAPN